MLPSKWVCAFERVCRWVHSVSVAAGVSHVERNTTGTEFGAEAGNAVGQAYGQKNRFAGIV
jgi:hypothetical protein